MTSACIISNPVHKEYHHFVEPGNCILMHPHAGPRIYRKEERE